MSVLDKARSFVYRSARPLDLARWQYHFEQGTREAVLAALAFYQNEDGGFGHALEPDSWNPNSSPIQTWTATEILREIGCAEREHPIIRGILRYLDCGRDFDSRHWSAVVASNNDYPHAPWWHSGSASSSHHSYNPTACLAGFALAYADRNSRLFETAAQIAREAVQAYFAQGLLDDMHTALCYIRLMEYAEQAGAEPPFDLPALKAMLREQVQHSITGNTAEWESGYVCRPSQFLRSRESLFYADNRELSDYECGFIEHSQLEDGSWLVPWGWNGYPDEWAISRTYWKANLAILQLLYLQGFSKL